MRSEPASPWTPPRQIRVTSHLIEFFNVPVEYGPPGARRLAWKAVAFSVSRTRGMALGLAKAGTAPGLNSTRLAIVFSLDLSDESGDVLRVDGFAPTALGRMGFHNRLRQGGDLALAQRWQLTHQTHPDGVEHHLRHLDEGVGIAEPVGAQIGQGFKASHRRSNRQPAGTSA